MFNTKAMVTCKGSATVVKKLTSSLRPKSKPKLLQGFISPVKPWALRGCNGKHIQSTVPTVSQVM